LYGPEAVTPTGWKSQRNRSSMASATSSAVHRSRSSDRSSTSGRRIKLSLPFIITMI
jgi:hypothetical protein